MVEYLWIDGHVLFIVYQSHNWKNVIYWFELSYTCVSWLPALGKITHFTPSNVILWTYFGTIQLALFRHRYTFLIASATAVTIWYQILIWLMSLDHISPFRRKQHSLQLTELLVLIFVELFLQVLHDKMLRKL